MGNWNLRRLPHLFSGLAVLLLSACSRSSLEQAFAPDPSLINGTASSAESTTTTAASPDTSPSQSSAPGGGNNPRANNPQATTSPSPTPSLFGGKPGNEETTPQSSAETAAPENASTANRQADKTAPDRQASQAGVASTNDISDADVPSELRETVAAVLALGVLTPANTSSGEEAKFTPNQPVTRGQFAQWLLATNNAVYGDRPALQIRSATGQESSVFKDIPVDSPQYAAIQGLAEAGIIPSSLSGAQEQINFNPDAPLSREDMLLWKVPLDARQALPSSNLEAVKEAWGFQDASKISAPALRAVLADYSNGDQAVIRRVFGYTTILQPQKSVTQAEAAAALGYFGSSGQGIAAADVQ